MGFQQITLNTNNFTTQQLSGTDSYVISGISDIENQSSSTTITNNDNAFIFKHTFDEPKYINRITLNMGANTANTCILTVTDTNGNDIVVDTYAPGSGEVAKDIPQPSINPIKYVSFQYTFISPTNSSTTIIDYINVFTPYYIRDYNIEFDDSLIDMASWNNARYDGCKISGSRINVFTEGDPIYPYGLKPIIENKTCAIFIGNSIEQGEVTSSLDPLVDISNHSYVTIDTILLVNLQTLKSTKITHEQFNETENKKESFRRLVADNFPEGSKIVTKILDIATSAQLKESHHVKFNQGLLMKLYAYTANDEGKEDGVFGGYGIRDEKGNLIDNVVSGGGLFGFGTTVATSASLFGLSNGGLTTFTAYTTIEELPSELSLYGNIGDITHLSPATASGTPTSDRFAYVRRVIE